MKSTLNLIEIFESIQGETSLTGLPTIFIRLAACNLRCSWCDTAYSFGRGDIWSFESILEKIKMYGSKYVCITGGEPLLQKNVHLLMPILCDLGHLVSLETGGSLSIEDVDARVKIILDVKCPGSGMEKKNFWPNLQLLKPHDELKFVIADEADYSYAKEIISCRQIIQPILFSPVFGKLEPKTLVEWILKDHLPVRLNLQIHKFIWDPCTKGV